MPGTYSLFNLLKDTFDILWQEGEQCPKMMGVGLHGRISGHPTRAMALARFLDYVRSRDRMWICRRLDGRAPGLGSVEIQDSQAS